MARAETITSVVPWLVIRGAEARGVATGPLWSAAGLDAQAVPAADQHTDADRYVALWDVVVAAVGRADFAVRLGSQSRIEDNEVFGFLAMSCATLGEAFERTAKYRALYNAGARWEMELGASAVRLIHYPWPSATRSVGRRASVEFAVADMANAATQLAGRRIQPLEVHFAPPAPPDVHGHREVFGVTPSFGARLDELVYPADLPSVPIRSFNSKLRDYFDAQCRQLAESLPKAAEVSAQVRGELLKTMDGGDCGMETIARRLGLSGRSLHRRLSDERVRFADLLDEVRQEIAKRYLTRRSVTASEVAYLIGFQSPTAFFRAFKRWTGQTPRSFLASAPA